MPACPRWRWKGRVYRARRARAKRRRRTRRTRATRERPGDSCRGCICEEIEVRDRRARALDLAHQSESFVAHALVVDHDEDVLEEPGEHRRELGDRREVLRMIGAAVALE